MPAETLALDELSMSAGDLSIPALMRELNLQQKPNWILRKLMNALESKRQARGMGWSRAWNKYGLNVFRTHVQDVASDAEYFAPLGPVMDRFQAGIPAYYREFIAQLLNDPSRLAFTFYHNHDVDGVQYEGLTLSLGRKVATDKTKRDRLDIILEDLRVDGRVDGRVDRLRVYVCPWELYQNNKEHHALDVTAWTPETSAPVQSLYESCVRSYHLWKGDELRQWSHWSARYIDYFGPRSFIPVGTSFS